MFSELLFLRIYNQIKSPILHIYLWLLTLFMIYYNRKNSEHFYLCAVFVLMLNSVFPVVMLFALQKWQKEYTVLSAEGTF